MDNKKLGEQIYKLRKEKGLTQADLAEELNVSPQAVSKWENGESAPDISLLVPLSRMLGTTVDGLLGVETETVRFEEGEEKVDLKNVFLKIRVDDNNGDKVNVNLPLSLAKPYLERNPHVTRVIDFKQIMELVESGAIGEIVSVNSNDGDHVHIYVERIK